MSTRGGGGSWKASARWVEAIVSSGSRGGGTPFQSWVEVGREGDFVRSPAIFLLPPSFFRYLSVGADGGGYTNCVPIKMDPLSLSATEHMRSD